MQQTSAKPKSKGGFADSRPASDSPAESPGTQTWRVPSARAWSVNMPRMVVITLFIGSLMPPLCGHAFAQMTIGPIVGLQDNWFVPVDEVGAGPGGVFAGWHPAYVRVPISSLRDGNWRDPTIWPPDAFVTYNRVTTTTNLLTGEFKTVASLHEDGFHTNWGSLMGPLGPTEGEVDIPIPLRWGVFEVDYNVGVIVKYDVDLNHQVLLDQSSTLESLEIGGGAGLELQEGYGLVVHEGTLNDGKLSKSSGDGDFALASAVDNTGVVEAASGTLRLTGAANLAGGTFKATGGAGLELSGGGRSSGGTYALAGGGQVRYSGGQHVLEGSYNGSGDGKVVLYSGTVSVAEGTTATIHMSGDSDFEIGSLYEAALDCAGGLTNTGNMRWWSMTITGASGLTNLSDTFVISGAGGVRKWLTDGQIINRGRIEHIGERGDVIFENGTLHNEGQYDLSDGAHISDYGGSIVYNTGWLGKTTGPGNAEIEVPVDNTGVVEAASGTLRLTGAANLAGGTFKATGGAGLELSGGGRSSGGTYALAGGGQVRYSGGQHVLEGSYNGSGDGKVVLYSGTVSVAEGTTATIHMSGDSDFEIGSLYEAALDCAGGLTNTGNMRWWSMTITGASGLTNLSDTFVISGAGGVRKWLTDGQIINRGRIEHIGERGDVIFENGTLHNEGQYDLSDGAHISDYGGSIVYNTGWLGKTTGPGNAEIEVPVDNTGVVEAASGTLRLTGQNSVNDGIVRATGNGSLTIWCNTSGSGDYVADGGYLQFGSVSIDTTGDLIVLSNGHVQLSGTSMTARDLIMGSDARISVGSSLSLHGGLTFQMTDDSTWSWTTSSVLEMTGGHGAPPGDWPQWTSLEVGGADLGLDPNAHSGAAEGFTLNFHLENLVIGEEARVYLADLIDNGNRVDHGWGNPEALYVKNLHLEEGAILNVNGVHLYYEFLTGTGQMIDQPVPEPATLLLIALGGLAVVRRRR